MKLGLGETKKRTRESLTLEVKRFIIDENEKRPGKPVKDLLFAVSTKFGIQPSRCAIRNILRRKQQILASMKNLTEGGKQRKR